MTVYMRKHLGYRRVKWSSTLFMVNGEEVANHINGACMEIT
jgi:hypothetical protein